jgi:hypothetical protein
MFKLLNWRIVIGNILLNRLVMGHAYEEVALSSSKHKVPIKGSQRPPHKLDTIVNSPTSVIPHSYDHTYTFETPEVSWRDLKASKIRFLKKMHNPANPYSVRSSSKDYISKDSSSIRSSERSIRSGSRRSSSISTGTSNSTSSAEHKLGRDKLGACPCGYKRYADTKIPNCCKGACPEGHEW